MTYGYFVGGRLAVIQSDESHAATDDSVKNLWARLPDGLETDATTTTARGEDEDLQTWVDRVTAAEGWSPPEPPAPAPGPRKVPVGVFLDRIPFLKFAAIRAAEPTDAGVAAWLEVVRLLSEVDLDSPNIGEGLDYFISKSLITPADKAAALA